MAHKKRMQKIKLTVMSVLAVFLFGATIWVVYLGCARRTVRRSCPYGYYRSGNLCVQRKRCPTGYIRRGNSCIDPKLRPLHRNPMSTDHGSGGGGDGTDL